jgi:N6-L-threonylcarbamoyladenine synthase
MITVMIVLGIESSCDETAASVVKDGEQLLSNVVSSSMDLHAKYGGVIPEIAARSHIEAILPVIQQALDDAGCTWDDIDAIAVTYGAGLLGSLLIGVLAARTLAITKNKPLYAINHVEAHIYANFITTTTLDGYTLPTRPPEFPMMGVIVSGGHSQLAFWSSHFDYTLLGQTRDDAIAPLAKPTTRLPKSSAFPTLAACMWSAKPSRAMPTQYACRLLNCPASTTLASLV